MGAVEAKRLVKTVATVASSLLYTIKQVISFLVWKSNQKENHNKNLLSSVKILTLIDWKSL